MRDPRNIEGGIQDENSLVGHGIVLKLIAGYGISTTRDLLKV